MHLRSLVSLSLAAVLGAACAEQAAPDDPTSSLELTQADGAVIAGSFTYAGSLITFDSRLLAPEHAVLTLDVNGVQLTADADLAGGTFSSDGGLGALYADDTRALVALRDAIGAEHPELYAGLHGKLLVRHADRMAEAPVGWTLDRRVIDLAALGGTVEDRAGSCSNDSTTCLPGIGGYAYSYHDAAAHGCSASYDAYGNKASSCQGRCGAGCNWWFDDDMMQDCLDHDRCVDYHPSGGSGPGSADCGDEFWDADGDYVVTYGAYCPN